MQFESNTQSFGYGWLKADVVGRDTSKLRTVVTTEEEEEEVTNVEVRTGCACMESGGQGKANSSATNVVQY